MSSSAVWDVSSREDDAAAPWYDADNEEVEEGVCSSPEEAGDMFRRTAGDAQESGHPQCKERTCRGVLGS